MPEALESINPQNGFYKFPLFIIVCLCEYLSLLLALYSKNTNTVVHIFIFKT